MAGGEILIKWVSDSGAAIRDMARVNRALGDSASKADRWSRRLDTASNVAQGAFVGLAAAAWQVTKKASDQEQAIGSLQAVFKDLSPEIERAADAAWEFGLSKTDYAQMAAVMGAQLKNLGQDSRDAATETQNLIALGGDLAAQFGGTTKEAVEAIGSALRGERDPIERYAISLNEASIQAKMAEGNLSKTEATMALLNEQAKKSGALGAAGREAETFAAGMQQVSASFDNLNSSMGKALGGGKKGGALGDLARSLSDLSDWVDDNPDTFKAIIGGIAGISAALIGLKAALAVASAFQKFLGLLKAAAKFPFWAELAAVIDALKDQFDEFDMSVGGVFRGLKDLFTLDKAEIDNWWVTRFVDAAIAKFKQLWEWMRKVMPDWMRVNDAGVVDGTTGIGGGAGITRMTAPTLPSQVGRLQPAPAGTSVAVFVDGQKQRARMVLQPDFTPAVAGMGML